MLEHLQAGKKGDWSIQHFTITEEEARKYNLYSLMSFSSRGNITAGEYTGLYHAKRGVVMSDTPLELRDLWGFERRISKSAGQLVHINGLGLGICTKMALDAGAIVEVVEIDPDVIELVGTQIAHPNLTIIQADAMEWMPPKDARYAVVWHDIWDTMSGDNLPEMSKLHRRYGRKADWQSSWGHEYCRRDR